MKSSNYLPFSLTFFPPVGRKDEYSDWSDGNSTDQGRGFFEQMPVPFQGNVLVSDTWLAYNKCRSFFLYLLLNQSFPLLWKIYYLILAPWSQGFTFPIYWLMKATVFFLRSLEHKGACPGLAATSSTPSRQTSLPLEHIIACLHPPLLILPQSTQASLGTRRE